MRFMMALTFPVCCIGFSPDSTTVARNNRGHHGSGAPMVQERPSTEKQAPISSGAPTLALPLAKAFAAGVDSEELHSLAISATRSMDQRELDELVKLLRKPRFLEALDKKLQLKSRVVLVKGARLAEILRELARNQPEKGQSALLQLGSDEAFMSDHRRVYRFIEACGEFKQPTNELLDYLDTLIVDHPLFKNDLVSVLVTMGSTDSIRRVEKRCLSEPGGPHPAWFTDHLIEIRDRDDVVELYHRTLKQGIRDAKFRNIIVQTLFNDKHGKWYSIDRRIPKIPNRYEATDEAVQKLLAIAELTEKLDLTDETRASVARGRKQIEEIINFRTSGQRELVARLIAALDSASFEERERAMRALEQFGPLALPQLQEAGQNPASLEAGRRIDILLRNRKNER